MFTNNFFTKHDPVIESITKIMEADDKGLALAHAKAKEISKSQGVVQHINKDPDGSHHVSDWYDDDSTVASYNKGKPVNEELKGNQKVLDKNKNNKLDPEDFKILRGEKKGVKEEVESIDEADDSHGVHINGRLWNVFKTKSHAENVAKKIKGATVHKYDAKELQRQAYQKSVSRNIARGKDVDESVELGEGSVSKEKQKTPYRDIKSAEYRAAAEKQKQRMDKDKAAEPGKKLLAKQRVAEDYDESVELDEGSFPTVDDARKAHAERSGPQPSGGSGIKQGSRYGGSKQKEKPEHDTDETGKRVKEEIDPNNNSTDTLAGPVKGKSKNPFLKSKVMMDVPGNVNEAPSDLHPAAQQVLKHIKPEHHAKYTPDMTNKTFTGSYADRRDVLNAAKSAGHLKEDTDLHPAAQQVLKHIKPEHHAKYTPDLSKNTFTGSYADRRDVLNAAKSAGHMKEEVENLDEAKSSYELYHPQYSGAIHHALAHHASTSGLSVADDDYHNQVAIGPRKPAEGQTVSHSLPATDAKGAKHMIHMQIYNRGGDKKPFELNTYSSKISGRAMKEEIEGLDERELKGDEPAEKERIAKGMKKNLKGFKSRYGERAKSVLFATATKLAKGK